MSREMHQSGRANTSLRARSVSQARALEPGTDDSAGRSFDELGPELNQVIEEYAAALQEGRHISREEFVAAHPGSPPALVEALEALEDLHRAAPGVRLDPELHELATPLSQEPLGDFRIIREIGRGGMGIVYEATQMSLGRRVALKVLPFAAALDPRSLARFRQESQAAAQLDHPHIVHVYGIGNERGVHYYAMQFIEGRSLAQLIAEMRGREPHARSAGRLARIGTGAPGLDTAAWAALSTERSVNRGEYFRTIARIVTQVAQALDFAHNSGILHRDVKPGNLLLDSQGTVWITDFGLARVETDANLTLTGDVLGTLRYMSPEQALARRGSVDERTDVYSLGITLYELLTLEPAFPGDDRRELLQHIANDDPKQPRQIDRSIPAELETIVLKAIEKEPADRYATAHELALDLERFLENQPLAARRATPLERLVKWSRRKRTLVRSVAVALLLLLVGSSLAAFIYARQQRGIAEAREDLVRKQARLNEQTASDLYRALLSNAESLRIARAPNYRNEVWAQLRKAVALPAARSDSHKIRELAVACLGDPYGMGQTEVPAEIPRQGRQLPKSWHDALSQIARYSGTSPPAIAMSRDGSHFAFYNAGLKLGNQERIYGSAAAPLGFIHHLQFDPSGRLLAGGCEEGIAVWSVPDLSLQMTVKGEVVRAVAMHPTGQLLAAFSREHCVELWSLASHRLLHRFFVSPRADSIEISADGNYLLATTGGKVTNPGVPGEQHREAKVLEAYPITATPEKRLLLGHTGGVTGLAFSPDDRLLASVSKDRTLRVWDTGTGAQKRVLEGHQAEIQDVVFSPDGDLLASGDWGAEIDLWRLETGERLARIGPPDNPDQIWRLQFDPQGRYLAAGGRGGLRVFALARAADGLQTFELASVDQKLYDIAIHPAGRQFALLDQEGRLFSWQLAGDPLPNPLPVAAQVGLCSLAFDLEGNSLSYITSARSVGLWDWDRARPAGRTRQSFSGSNLMHLARARAGGRIAVAEPANQIAIYDLDGDRELARLPPEAAEIWSLCWNSEGTRLAAGLTNGTIVLWDLASISQALSDLGIDLPLAAPAPALTPVSGALSPGEFSKLVCNRFRDRLTELAARTPRLIRSGEQAACDAIVAEATRLSRECQAFAPQASELRQEFVHALEEIGAVLRAAGHLDASATVLQTAEAIRAKALSRND